MGKRRIKWSPTYLIQVYASTSLKLLANAEDGDTVNDSLNSLSTIADVYIY